MKKQLLSMILVLILAGLGSCSKSTSPVVSTNTGTSPLPDNILIQNLAFNPSTITVTVNSTVKWTNKDLSPHTITSDTGLFDSGAIGTDGTFSFKFTAPGTYSYHCTIHPSMTGSVIVH